MLAYDSTLRVPLIAGVAAAEAQDRHSHRFAAWISPHRCFARSVPAGETCAPSTSLPPLHAARDSYAETHYPATAGWHPIKALATKQWKLLLSSEAELYDMTADPSESTEPRRGNPGIVRQLTSALQERERSAGTAPAATVSQEASERLRSLGYVSGATQSTPDRDAPNPAKAIDGWHQFERALSQLNAGRTREALPLLKALAVRFPSGAVFQSTYARALMESGDAKAALERYRDVAARWPKDAMTFHDLAVAARAAGQLDEARRAEQAALALDANSAAAINGLGLIEVDAGRLAEAARAFERAANADPSNASYWTNLGNARRGLGDVTWRGIGLSPRSRVGCRLRGCGKRTRRAPRAAAQGHGRDPLVRTGAAALAGLLRSAAEPGDRLQQSGNRDRAIATYRSLLADAPPRFTRERRAATELLAQLR